MTIACLEIGRKGQQIGERHDLSRSPGLWICQRYYLSLSLSSIQIHTTLNSMAASSIETRGEGTVAPVSSQSHSGSFLPKKLFSLLTNETPTVTSSLASSPSASIDSVATHLYGKHHGAAHHSLHADEAKEGDTKDSRSGGTLDKFMGKLHLSKSHEATESPQGEGKDKDVTNPAADQWASMRALRANELEEIKRCGQWGAAQPSELFLNVNGWTSESREILMIVV